jgi:hypothetical protein
MHKNVELLIGRLATDPRFRRRFAEDAGALLRDLVSRGFELTTVEADALASLDPEAIDVFASVVDRRLRHAAPPTLNSGND